MPEIKRYNMLKIKFIKGDLFEIGLKNSELICFCACSFSLEMPFDKAYNKGVIKNYMAKGEALNTPNSVISLSENKYIYTIHPSRLNNAECRLAMYEFLDNASCKGIKKIALNGISDLRPDISIKNWKWKDVDDRRAIYNVQIVIDWYNENRDTSISEVAFVSEDDNYLRMFSDEINI